MSKYSRDGGVVSSKLPMSQRNSGDHRSMFGVYRGVVLRSIYPDEPESVSKARMEYVIRVRGQNYPNAMNLKMGGGIYNTSERVRKGIEKSFSGKIDDTQYDENLDGEHVFVMFIQGNGDIPLIIGSDTHSRQKKVLKKADGLVDINEFNGLEVRVDKDSNYTVKHVGRMDPEGKVLNKDAVDSGIKIYGATGDIELNTHGEGKTDLKIRFTKADKKLELMAQENVVVMSEAGVSITDKFENNVVMKDGSIEFTAKGDFKVKSDGDVDLDAGGNFKVKGEGGVMIETPANAVLKGEGGTNLGSDAAPTNVLGAIVNLAGGGAPVARLGDMVVGTGNLGAPVVSQILQGSPKVTAG